MKDWIKITDKFLQFNDQQILENSGKISHADALAKAQDQYEKFSIKQDKQYISEFDKAMKKYLKGK